MTAICDAGPLIALAKIGLLDRLPSLYPATSIPSAVHHEAVVGGVFAGRDDARVIEALIESGRIKIIHMENADLHPPVASLLLGRGEKQAIELALHTPSALLLLDDLHARRAAQSFGLRIKGTLGVIVGFFRAGLITRARCQSAFGAIVRRDDIWMNPALVWRVWQEIEEENSTST